MTTLALPRRAKPGDVINDARNVVRLLPAFDITEAVWNLFRAIAGGENKGYVSGHQFIGNRIRQLISQVDIDDRCIELVMSKLANGLRNVWNGADHLRSLRSQGPL